MHLDEGRVAAASWMLGSIEPFRALLREALPHVDRLDS